MTIDTQILGSDELFRIPECINALANSSGGLIRIEDGREIRVAPLEWYEKPQILDGRVWRRIEGENIISGVWAKSVMASRYACDDFPADDAALHEEYIGEFRDAVIALHPELAEFSRTEFMRRTGILSGKHVTSAGALMFGEAITVSAVLTHGDIHAKIEACNIWEAYTDILPRITRTLSAKSAQRVRDAVITALLHSDYSLDSHINIFILSGPARIETDSPGIITHALRNHRLSRLAGLAGITADIPHLEHDMLNFRTVTTTYIEGISAVKL
ncbi:MAG: hypothetical protein IJS28_08245 [Synergistaceae bacterium]|nr:hypothetical protein [Synergistaceae bacterium]